MRPYLFAVALLTLLSASPAQAQVTIEVAKITCLQFVSGEIGQPRTVAAWLSGYYHGKKNSTSVDKQAFEIWIGARTSAAPGTTAKYW
jgi:acid stress chaperone HdeB